MTHGIGPERSMTERLDLDEFEVRQKSLARTWMDDRSGTVIWLIRGGKEMVTVSKGKDGARAQRWYVSARSCHLEHKETNLKAPSARCQ